MGKKHVVSIVLAITLALTLCACQGARRDVEPNYKPYTTYDTNQNIAKGHVINTPYETGGKRYTPMSVQEAAQYRETGEAVWYGDEIYLAANGHMQTAAGELFDESLLTAAHKFLPLPTYVKVTNLANNKSVVVRVNDRGPFNPNCLIALSRAAANKLGFAEQGAARVLVEALQVGGNDYTPKR